MFPWNMFPFDKNSQRKFLEMKPEEIENYVQQMMGKMLQPDIKGMFKPEDWLKGMQQQSTPPSDTPTDQLNVDIFETHDFVYVRIPLKSDWLNKMKLFYTTNQVIIEHIPELDDKHTVVLPATVKRKGASATHRDGVVELRLPKSVDLQFSEIDIST
ncbi:MULTISPECIES: Hsp20/alpha crystallin family protein [Mesobacillus]|uniref:Spore coat protein n=2 Tax=Mesobacillus TaxID=2675231 RepID=A0A0D6Z599_9BACI|nr:MULTISPECIES: Hsp20/alpha crystallin family protein [Mesobacillus]KIY20914.1 spore coat protein [Mesobacillus subterraneus]MDQ0411957.1 HSP20 family molecular chaperone IbpA [Mesobacillus stamsii]